MKRRAWLWLLLTVVLCFLLQGCDLGIESATKSVIKKIPGGWLLLRIQSIPDWDQLWTRHPGFFSKLLLGTHRSAVTHSVLVVLIPGFLLMRTRMLGFATTLILGFTIGIHFLFDMNPNGWFYDKSWIHFPVLGSLSWIPLDGNLIPVIVSWLWLLGNAILCFVAPFAIYQESLDS